MMSNVLIGIIGVILFIGLALAGALFLGPRFQEASNSSKASALVSGSTDVLRSVEMFRLQEGRSLRSDGGTIGMTDLIEGKYLKAAPPNPVLSGQAGPQPYALGSDNEISHILVLLPNPSNRAVCEVIQRQYGTLNADGTFNDTPKTREQIISDNRFADCVRTSGTFGPVSTRFTGYMFLMRAS